MSGAFLFRPWLEQVAELSPLVAILAKMTVLLAAAWSAHALLLRANPRWRVLLWREAVLGLLLIPLCHFAIPPIGFQLPAATVKLTGSDVVGLTSAGAAEPLTRAVAGPAPPALVPLPIDDASAAHELLVAGVEAPRATSWRSVLLAIWGGGCLFFFLRLAIGLRRIRSLVQDSESAPADVEAALARVARELSRTAPADVRVSARITVPILCGLFRPTLLIPRRMASASRAEQLPGVFAHELAHVLSRDLTWNLLLHSISAVLWFHPLAWYARAAHAAACESVSDAVAAGYLGDAEVYSRTLARVALDAVGSPTLSLAMARASDVERRVQALKRRVFDRPLSWQFAGAAIVCCLITAGALGGFKAVRAEVPEGTPQPDGKQGLRESFERTVDKNGDAADEATKDILSSLITAETEAAVNRALAFLAERQREDGSFGGKKVGHLDPAITALCGMALLATGSKPGEGPYGTALQKAVDYLLNQVQEDGFIGIQPNAGSMYAHAYALRFLAEAQLAHGAARTERAIAKAVDLIVKSQNARDGWRYTPTSLDADSSVTSCQVIALQAARRAGLEVPQATLDRATKYLARCQTADGGYAYVLPPHGSALPRSASVMSALYLSGVDGPQIQKGLLYLNARATPPDSTSPHFYFAQFHLSTALRYAGAEHFRRWYGPSRDQLLELQADDGSWLLPHYQPEYATAKACVVLLSPRQRIAGRAEEKQPGDTDANGASSLKPSGGR